MGAREQERWRGAVEEKGSKEGGESEKKGRRRKESKGGK